MSVNNAIQDLLLAVQEDFDMNLNEIDYKKKAETSCTKCFNHSRAVVTEYFEEDEENLVSADDKELIKKMYKEKIADLKAGEGVFSSLSNIAAIMSGFSIWMVNGIEGTIHCPAFSILITLCAALSISMVIIFVLLGYLSSRLKGAAQADFVHDTRYFRSIGFLLLLYSLILFMASFGFKLQCDVNGGTYSTLLPLIFFTCTLALLSLLGRVLYEYSPRLLGLVLLAPVGGLGLIWFPDMLEELGIVKTKRERVTTDDLFYELTRELHLKKKNGNKLTNTGL